MKVIIAGGRDYQMTQDDAIALQDVGISEVVSGGAIGADTEGANWARRNGLPVKYFLPDWKAHGKAAGPIRNRQMAEYADAVVLFAGGAGTQSMFDESRRSGIRIFDWRDA